MEHSNTMIPLRKGNRRGIALLLVLMLVVLTTILIVALLASVQTETKSTRSSLAGQNAQQLASLAEQTVISQIQQATTKGTQVAWASQPGMIRCYNNAGAPLAWYKLYSATDMVKTPSNPESLSDITADLPTPLGDNWNTSTSSNYGVFTDINSPIYAADGSGTLIYPIVDPSRATSIAQHASPPATPIVGFDVTTASTPGYSGGANSISSASPINNPAAMPVRWLYVLGDGTLVPAASGGQAAQVSVPGSSSTNPIVGRVAFWTDDETSKLNVNTAADGTYFDTPRFSSMNINSTSAAGHDTEAQMAATSTTVPGSGGQSQRDIDRIQDKQMAVSPPVSFEYQRWVGQPAQTRLSYVLPNMASLDLGSRSNVFSNTTPFLYWLGTTQAGLYTDVEQNVNGIPDFNSTTYQSTVGPTRNTPFASLDEWMFSTSTSSSPALRVPNKDLSGNFLATGNPSNTTSNPTIPTLQQLRFFLTTSSEAPELNLFGQPRISIWPISNHFNPLTNATTPSSWVTTNDTLLANAATLFPGGTSANPYYFTRQSSTSSTIDYTVKNSAGVARNQALFQYLRNLATKSIPGYGGVFNTKYQTPEMDQILTEIFDYIRSTNPSDPQLSQSGTTFSTTRTQGDDGATVGGGQVVPIIIPISSTYSTKGFGRFFSISEIALDFNISQAPSQAPGNTTQTMTAMLLVGLYSPSLGPGDIVPDMRIEIDPQGSADGIGTGGTGGLQAMTIQAPATPGTPLQHIFGPANANGSYRTVFSMIPNAPAPSGSGEWHSNPPYYDILWGGAAGPRQAMTSSTVAYNTTTGSTPPTPYSDDNYMFCGIPITVPLTGNMAFAATPLKIILSWSGITAANENPHTDTVQGNGTPGTVANQVQVINVVFPAFTAPVPQYNSQTLTNEFVNLIYGPGSGYGTANNQYLICSGNTVRSIIVGYNGDARLVAAQPRINATTPSTTVSPTAAASAFAINPQFNTATTAIVHSLRDIFTSSKYLIGDYSSNGNLVNNVTYGTTGTFNGLITDHYPSSDAPDTTGDFDNGPGSFPDGPYINKADETGAQYAVYPSNSPLPYYTGGDSGSSASFTYSNPNRTVASPVTFGSLPTGAPVVNFTTGRPVLSTVAPWQTLLFRPQPNHPSNALGSPEDELLLDWFWMPVVEPYSISTTLATAGKVNMNYQIAPFTYITRATALIGVLGSEYVIAVPNSDAAIYKDGTPTTSYRSPVRVLEDDGITIDASTGTLDQFIAKFNSGQIYRSASEICDINLVPQSSPFDPTSATAAASFWRTHALTGDNSRERPYNGLYPRLTTKSNTYTIHVRAQALKQPSNATAGVWVEDPAKIMSEYRGSVTINRYLDPDDANIPDAATNTSASLESYYKYRVIETRRFLP